MRAYLRRQRVEAPETAIWERARRRARRSNIPFSIGKDHVIIPAKCPALGISIHVGGPRSNTSPSLDRIKPEQGYIPGNVRVISDRANRIKGNRRVGELRQRALTGTPRLRRDYGNIAAYVEREELLAEVRRKALMGGSAAAEWSKIAEFLDRAFARG